MKNLKACLVALLAAALVTALVAAGVLRRLDRWAQDAVFQHPGVPSGDIVIIGIDETALDILGPYNTWDRNIMASALEALAADPDNLPAAVAVDILYAGETSVEADLRLAQAAADLGCVVTASMAEFGREVTYEDGRAVALNASAVVNYVQPFFELSACSTQGHINAMLDRDGILRHALLYVDPAPGRRVWSMACETARIFMEKQGKTLRLPQTSAGGHYYVPFTGHPGDYSDGASIAMLIAGKIPAGYWANKIVLIGPYAPALQDAFYTPIDKNVQMYGVEYQANVIQCLIDGRFRTDAAELPQLIALFVLCAAAMFFFRRLNVARSAAVCGGLVILGLAVPFVLYQLGWVAHILWLPTAVLALFIGAMAEKFARAVRERRALALEKERIGAELALATRIQASALPKVFPPFPDRKEFDVYASMTPAKEVGGDFYDFFMIDSDHLGVVIGDVSGKGVPASLFMMVAMALIRHVSMHETSPAKVLQAVNVEICTRNPEEMFVTVWLAVLEISTGIVTAANAGHEFPAIRRRDGHFELLKDRHGFVVGGMSGVRYREYQVPLQPGEKLFVYTDGVAEATDAAEQMYGTDRMIEALRSCEDGTPEQILDTVHRSVNAFVGLAPQFDDLTMVCLQYNGPAETGSGDQDAAPGPEAEG